MRSLLYTISVLLFTTALSAADLRLHPLFSDHAVLQQELPVPVWGEGKPGADVAVFFGGQRHDSTVNEEGRWMVVLEPLADWKEKVEKARSEGVQVQGRAPRAPIGPDHVKRPAAHYNAMIAPLQPLAMRGVIWYQGEGNSREPFYPEYKDLMLTLVDDWRGEWAAASGGLVPRREFPFYLVQLPNFGNAEGLPASPFRTGL